MSKEGLYSSIVNASHEDTLRYEGVSQHEKNLNFAMQCNGYVYQRDRWDFYSEARTLFQEEFKGQRVAFYGPNNPDDKFYSGFPVNAELLSQAFDQQPVTDALEKFLDTDVDQAARITFLLGGIVRHFVSIEPDSPESRDKTARAVAFTARMTRLGQIESRDAIASTMAMYVISGGSLAEDREFMGDIYHMAGAIEDDPVYPTMTAELGLSQVARLRSYRRRIHDGKHDPLPDISEHVDAFEGFPTVGAEFHFSPDIVDNDLWQKLALLNMSQYQKGSYIQMSRNDRDVIEVRMNPSIYPVTIANWEQMRRVLPELDRAFFHVTLNRNEYGEDFDWRYDDEILNSLKAMGMLSYAGLFEDIPDRISPEEIDFGTIYLGQTVRMSDGSYVFTGAWGGGQGHYGQLSVYAGFRHNLPHLSYFLSMGLANPDILKSIDQNLISDAMTLEDALALSQPEINGVFRHVEKHIEDDDRLRNAAISGEQIIWELSP